MKTLPSNFDTSLLIAFGLAAVLFVMVVLARWARRRSRGALVAGALLSMFAPDPTLERNIRLAEEAKQVQCEEDEEGEVKEKTRKEVVPGTRQWQPQRSVRPR